MQRVLVADRPVTRDSISAFAVATVLFEHHHESRLFRSQRFGDRPRASGDQVPGAHPDRERNRKFTKIGRMKSYVAALAYFIDSEPIIGAGGYSRAVT